MAAALHDRPDRSNLLQSHPLHSVASTVAMKETTIESHQITSYARTVERTHTPTLASPPHESTPPASGRHNYAASRRERQGSEAVDPVELSKALEEAGSARERTPGGSPSRKKQRMVYGDRSVISCLT